MNWNEAAGVQLGVRLDRDLLLRAIEHRRVAVENLADLLARERLDVAVREREVARAVGGKPQLGADPADLVRRNAVLRERADERLLDREHLLVLDFYLVAACPVDMVVDLLDRIFVDEPHLAGVVLAGRDGLELGERNVYVCEIDGTWHGSVLSVFKRREAVNARCFGTSSPCFTQN